MMPILGLVGKGFVCGVPVRDRRRHAQRKKSRQRLRWHTGGAAIRLMALSQLSRSLYRRGLALPKLNHRMADWLGAGRPSWRSAASEQIAESSGFHPLPHDLFGQIVEFDQVILAGCEEADRSFLARHPHD